MNSDRVTLEQCGRDGKLRGLPPGEYALEYHDSTHLIEDEWVQILTVNVYPSSIKLDNEDEDIEPFYTIVKQIGDLPEKPRAKSGKGEKQKEGGADPLVEYTARVRAVTDALSLALARVGLIAPYASSELLDQVVKLNSEDGVVIVPDTNALHNGALHWLLKVLYRPAVWVLPLVTSLTTVQTRDAMVKNLVGKRRPSSIRQALRSRGLVNGTLGLLERNKGRYQVVEIDPSLLRYQKTASGSGSDPDQSDVLEDRLIIEGIHNVLRSMRSRTARVVVTSDTNVARILETEGIETLFVPGIEMSERPIGCLRYDPLMRGFVGAPLRALLWELTHAFGAVRLVRGGRAIATFECYWPSKSPVEWASEKLACTFSVPDAPIENLHQDQLSNLGESSKERAKEQNPEAADISAEDNSVRTKPVEVESRKKGRDPSRSMPSLTVLPRASLPQVLRLLGAIRRLKSGNVEQVVQASDADPVTADTARRAIEILRRVRLVEQEGLLIRPTGDAEIIDVALRGRDLDTINSVFLRFGPYKIFSEILRERGSIAREEVFELLKARIGVAGRYEIERLPRYHTLLGQAWTAGDAFRDGSSRPTDRDVTDAFEEAFSATASVGLAKVVELLPRFCELIRMSPWAAKIRIEKIVADRLLPNYSFQPAAGGKPIVRDEVVAGSLNEPMIEPVALDRLHLGERPVFTVGGPAR